MTKTNRILPEDFEWTPEILERAVSGNYRLHDPCVICGDNFRRCIHTVRDTEAVIYHGRNMTRAERKRIMERE